MQEHELAESDDDVARLFREHDDIGPDSSLWLRPLRQLFQEGKPVGQMVGLSFAPVQSHPLPFGVLSATGRERLVFWPVLPPGAHIIFGVESVDALDHVTLELPSEKVHVTAYDANGAPVHFARSWRTEHFAGSGFALWFLLLVQVRILEEQATAVQRRVQVPPTDRDRRVEEFARFARGFRLQRAVLPPIPTPHSYVYCGVYLGPELGGAYDLSKVALPAGESLRGEVEGWPDGTDLQVAVSPLRIGERTICVAAACPPGKLLTDVVLGLPKRSPGGLS